MSVYSRNFINNPLYEDVVTHNVTFFGKFQNEAIHKVACIENNLIVFNDSLHRSKGEIFSKWLKETKILDRPCKYTFHHVFTRLASKKIENRKNADLREFVYFQNFYMVKKYFTMGLQTVSEDTYHFIMTTKKLVDLFIATKKISQSDGYFEKTFEYDFQKLTLDAEKTVIMYPGYQYILIAPSKSIFYFSKAYQQPLSNIHSLTVPNEVPEGEEQYEGYPSGLEIIVPPEYKAIPDGMEIIISEHKLNGFGLETNEIQDVEIETNRVQQNVEKQYEPIASGIGTNEIQDVEQQYKPIMSGLEKIVPEYETIIF